MDRRYVINKISSTKYNTKQFKLLLVLPQRQASLPHLDCWPQHVIACTVTNTSSSKRVQIWHSVADNPPHTVHPARLDLLPTTKTHTCASVLVGLVQLWLLIHYHNLLDTFYSMSWSFHGHAQNWDVHKPDLTTATGIQSIRSLSGQQIQRRKINGCNIK